MTEQKQEAEEPKQKAACEESFILEEAIPSERSESAKSPVVRLEKRLVAASNKNHEVTQVRARTRYLALSEIFDLTSLSA